MAPDELPSHADSGRPSQRERLEVEALRRLRAALEHAGWKVSRPSSGRRRPDLLCCKGELSYAVVVKASAGRARRAVLPALLADAILQARAGADEFAARPLAVLVASTLSPEIVAELGDYVRDFGGGVAWGALDGRGRFDLHGPELDAVRPMEQGRFFEDEPASARGSASAPNPFSDLGQWMLKVLVAPHVPERWLHAPRGRVGGVADLASLAQVSAASASKLVSALESSGYVVRAGGEIRLARVEALLEAWRVASQRPVKEIFARFLLPSPEPARRLRDVLAARGAHQPPLLGPGVDGGRAARVGPVGRRACLGLFDACRALDLGVVRGAPIHLYAEDLSRSFLEELELCPVEHRAEADLAVRRPAFPEAVFRASVLAAGVPVSDAIQCWLDVSSQSARGPEQAAEIQERLRWSEWGR